MRGDSDDDIDLEVVNEDLGPSKFTMAGRSYLKNFR